MLCPQAGILHSDWKSRLLQSRLELNIPAWKDGYNTWRKASSELYTEEPVLVITLRHTWIQVWLSLHGHKRKTGRMCSTVKSGFFQGVVGMPGGPLGRGVWRNGKHLLFILYTSVSSVQFSRSAVSGSLQTRGHIPNGHKPLYDLSILQKVWIWLFDLNFWVFYKKSEGLEKTAFDALLHREMPLGWCQPPLSGSQFLIWESKLRAEHLLFSLPGLLLTVTEGVKPRR